MRLKDYPEIVLDDIPKLYESHIKVFITHLYGLEEKVDRLPKQFCKMYTLQPIATQLLHYLRSRSANISEQDFHIVKNSEPFTVRLSDGKRLEMMLCAGNELENALMLLIRKLHGERLLYYYSAVQQDDLCKLMGNASYQKWIAQGTEVLFLNLQAVDQTFKHIDFEEVAKAITKNEQTVLKIPLLGYEYLIRRLAQTATLYGHISLKGNYLESYKSLSPDLRHFEQPGYKVTVLVKSPFDGPDKLYPLEKLQWSPVPNRINLIQLCSLLRPLHIHGIVTFHANGIVPPAPQYLKRFRFNYSPRSVVPEMEVHVPETQLIELSTEKAAQSPAKSQQGGTTPSKDPIVLSKQRKLVFVDYDDDDEDL
ncbi:uncharacterized protein LOC6558070 [Drosophila grimshawi]|uniref:GH14451 n=1 Tax=Drosophila grimshawi TaxID=7222 RepID=B4J0M7_DROGR|nr:uncharacterized protein LOC6558070 [Drosophila grimshawi]EDV97882.1 GH14451 [Drosophila grimshawi]